MYSQNASLSGTSSQQHSTMALRYLYKVALGSLNSDKVLEICMISVQDLDFARQGSNLHSQGLISSTLL